MFQILKDGVKYANYDREVEAREDYKRLKLWYKTSNIQVFKKTSPTKPSEVPLISSSGYYKEVFEGWRKLESSSIKGDGFTVLFERYGERTIDRMCDALNGWYTMWTKYRITFSDKKGKIAVVTKTNENADKIFSMVVDAKSCDDPVDEATVAETVRAVFTAIVNFVK